MRGHVAYMRKIRNACKKFGWKTKKGFSKGKTEFFSSAPMYIRMAVQFTRQ
jgi:hypothetical protein